MARKKIALIGGGQVGGTLAFILAQKELADLVLLDVTEGVPQGKSLDILHSKPIFNTDIEIIGTQDYSLTKNADIYIVSAGFPRKPGMSRDDLLKINAEIIKNIGNNIKKYSPGAFIIMITNPLDAMTQYMQVVTGFPCNRVVGMAGVLDGARFRAFLSQELNISVEDIQTIVLGGHGDTMVPISRYCTISGIPLSYFLSEEKLKIIVERVKNAGAEIVNLLKTGSAYYSPASGASDMVECILKDKHRLFCCSAYLKGEYGIKGYYTGVPIILGANGAEKVIELDLTNEEKEILKKSFESCKSNIDALKKLEFL